MRRHVAARLTVAAWLLLVWVLLWGRVDAAVLLGGIAAVAAAHGATRLPAVPELARFRPRHAVAAVAEIACDLAVSSVVIARHALWRPRRVGGALIEVRARSDSDLVLTLILISLSLRPGSLVLDIDRRRSAFFVHAMPISDPSRIEELRRSLVATEARLVRAFGTARDIEALDRTPEDP